MVTAQNVEYLRATRDRRGHQLDVLCEAPVLTRSS